MSHLDFPFPTIPETATLTTVAPGIHWLRMPLPFQLDHINLWLLEDGPGWTLVDTGLGDAGTREIWRRIFAEGLCGKPITRLLVTHCHPDHMGLAGWFAQEWGLRMWITQSEWLLGRLLAVDLTQEFVDGQVAFYRRGGFTADVLAQLGERGNIYSSRVTLPPVEMNRLRDGDALTIGGRQWRVIVGTGHSPEHACLHCEELGVLISGDQILPKITPIIGVWATEPDADPLGLYFESLDRFRRLPDRTLVLPSHNLPFVGLPARVRDIEHHHERRLDQTLKACGGEPLTGWQLLHKLFPRELDLHQTTFALGESLAHVHYLMRKGRIAREAGADGVWRYQSI